MPPRVFNQTDVTESKATEAVKDYEDVTNIVEGEDEQELEHDDVQIRPTTAYESDNIMNERFMMKTSSDGNGVDVSFIIKASVIAISTIFLSFIVFTVVYKQYKKSTNPLNYKEKHENGSRKANEEFSEIRFLTSDETLDFNLITVEQESEENITDL